MLSLMAQSRPAFQVAFLFSLPMLLAAIRGAFRVIGAAEALPAARTQIMGQSWIYIILPVLVPFWYLTNFICSLAGRRLKWRGIEYEVISSEQTRVLTP